MAARQVKSRSWGQWPRYSAACRRDVDSLLRRGGSLSPFRSNPDFPVGPVEGSWAWRLEREAEELFNIRHVIACNSGTMALQAALHALALPKGGEVITTPYTFSATTAAIVHAGLTPVFADVDEWGCLDRASVRGALTTKTVAILPVDLFGRVVGHRFDGLSSVQRTVVIEDACQAVGAFLPPARGGGINPLTAGRYGIIGAWSFNGAKNIPAGEAGAMVTDDDDLAARARLYVSHGENFHSPEIGLNGRINELTACVAYHGLRHVFINNARRRALAGILRALLADHPKVSLPDEKGHALYVLPLVLSAGVDRKAFAESMRRQGVEVGEGYIRPILSEYPAFRSYAKHPLPMATELSETTLCLLSCLTPEKPLSYARFVARSVVEALR